MEECLREGVVRMWPLVGVLEDRLVSQPCEFHTTQPTRGAVV